MTYTSLFLGPQQHHEDTMAQVMGYPAGDLCVGDVIEYYCMAFGAGDPRGHRRSTVLRIVPGEDYPVHVDTGEVLWKLTMICRVATSAGHDIPREDRRQWSIGRFRLLEGTLNCPTRLQLLGRAIANVTNNAIEDVLRHPSSVASVCMRPPSHLRRCSLGTDGISGRDMAVSIMQTVLGRTSLT
jgi:hypothetical protein